MTEEIDPVSVLKVREALARALASPEFRLSARMSQLLTYLVEAALDNRASELKETVVAVEVFGRSPGYDPKTDPVVRKEARRLRLKLQEYYQGTGASETVRIELPKGGYVPVFDIARAADAEMPARANAAEARPSQPGTRVRRGLRWGLAAGAGLVLLAGGMAVLRTDTRQTVLVPRPLTGNSGAERSPAFSADGRQIAFAGDAGADGEPAIYIQRLQADTPRRLTSSAAYENHPAWSPDGKSIAFLRRTPAGAYAITIRNLRDSTERILTEISAPDHLDWSPDGAQIATSDAVSGSPAAIVLISVADAGRRQVTIPVPGAGDTFPRFSPDGRRVAFLRAVAKDVAELYLLDRKTAGDPRRLTRENRKIEGYTWEDDNSLVLSLARGDTLRSLWRLEAGSGNIERIAAAGTLAYTPVYSPRSGVLAFVQEHNDINLWRIHTDGPAAPAMVTGSSTLDSCPSISPDGAQVAFRSDRSGTNEIWRTGLARDQPVRLTRMDGPLTTAPSWSPDGNWIAFDSRFGGNSDILLLPAAGGAWRKFTSTPYNEFVPRWSHDGKWIYFGSDRGGRWQIWKQPLAGGPAEQVTWQGGYVAAESPDGRYVYYTRGPTEPGLYRIPTAGGPEEPVLPNFAGKLWGDWAPARDGIYYLYYPDRDVSTNSTIRFLNLQTHQTRDVYRLPKNPVLWDGGLALSPDEKWIVFAELDYSGSNIQLLEPFK